MSEKEFFFIVKYFDKSAENCLNFLRPDAKARAVMRTHNTGHAKCDSTVASVDFIANEVGFLGGRKK